MARVTLIGVRKIYAGAGGQRVAVDGLDLAVADGEFVVLVGPSGCGKSTTLRMVAGLESISAGELKIGDRVVNDVAAKDRNVAMVFQNYALYPHMTAYENMAFNLKLRHLAPADIDRRVRLYVTHDQAEAMTLGDRIVVMNEGHAQQIDTPLAVYGAPANTFVAGFIGSPPMNLILGTVRPDGAFHAPSEAFTVPLPPRWRGLPVGLPVVFGIRPEHVTLAPNGQGAPFHVDLVEPLGQELLVYASAGGAEVTARLAPGTRVSADRTVRFAFAPEGINFFDAGTRGRIEGS